MKNKLIELVTIYSIMLKVKDSYTEVRFTQERGVMGRNYIKIDFPLEQWRSPEETIDLLNQIKDVVEKNFINK